MSAGVSLAFWPPDQANSGQPAMEGLLPSSCSGVTAERTLVKLSSEGRTVPGEGEHRLLRQMWLILCQVIQCFKVFSRVCLYVCSRMPASGGLLVCVLRCDGLSVTLCVFSDVLGCVYLSMFCDVRKSVAVLTFALCAFGWEVHTLVEGEGLSTAWGPLCTGCCFAPFSAEGTLSQIGAFA